MIKYAFWISVFMIILAIVLIWSGKGQDGTASTIIGSILVYWLSKGNNEKLN
ncbi:hypothetical protein SAMN05443529_1528 [Desulfosporosinus hippei DSM 8344]|uniref:Uncharacterized protein n=1 Tax=Desulfosporosinus hippei DSM 8344 TaxID=1121419 RepID=A0A1G8LP65_9FIRM|nr:hypothetical protein SAMN05443529_1528 [Desulfosporosinus hippei DSM 8344]